MTHTEESLMALADEYAFMNRTPADSQWSDPPSKSAKAALRLAIREVLAELNERPTKRLWDETATALEVLRKKFSEVLAERDEWKRMHEELAHASNESLEGVRELVQRAEKAEAECERLRKDAERYRWLRDADNWSEHGPCPMVATCEDTIYGTALDAVIDAALKDQP